MSSAETTNSEPKLRVLQAGSTAYPGGVSNAIKTLCMSLRRLGHEVTLFASGDSVTNARLVPVCPKSLRLAPECIDHYPHYFVMLEQVFREAAARFDRHRLALDRRGRGYRTLACDESFLPVRFGNLNYGTSDRC